MPSSSESSRVSASRAVSPGSSLPPGNSQYPAIGLSGGRWQHSTVSGSFQMRPAATLMSRRSVVSGIAVLPGLVLDGVYLCFELGHFIHEILTLAFETVV